MKFIDEAIITVKAGHGGPGSRSFRREKYTPLGGPDGGNGGRGGSVILIADPNRQTLIDFKFQPEWIAKNGDGGGGRLKDGSAGKDLVIQVPIGTQVFRVDDETLVADITEAGQEFVLAKGGRGGKGNNFFKTPTLQAPEHAQPGEPGEEGTFRFSLKLLADVALVGMPNAGKSTLISRISAAKPKIADYPFTTLSPNLGVVQYNQSLSFVVADIPGLIPGAHEGKGLGIGFLKHIERTRVILHLLDCGVNELMESDDQEGTENQISKIIENFELINLELRSFSQELSDKPQIVVLSKVDIVHDPELISKLKKHFEQSGHQVAAISSATGLGLKELLDAVVLQIKKASA